MGSEAVTAKTRVEMLLATSEALVSERTEKSTIPALRATQLPIQDHHRGSLERLRRTSIPVSLLILCSPREKPEQTIGGHMSIFTILFVILLIGWILGWGVFHVAGG